MSGSSSSSSSTAVAPAPRSERDEWLFRVLGIVGQTTGQPLDVASLTVSYLTPPPRPDFVDFGALCVAGGRAAPTADGALLATSSLSDEALAKLPPVDKALMIGALCSAGKPTGKALEQLCRLYRESPLDAAFEKERDQQKVAAVRNIAQADPKLGEIFPDGRINSKAWKDLANGAVMELLTKVHKAQAEALGITAVTLSTYRMKADKTGPSYGVFMHKTEEIRINLHLDALGKIKQVFITILHETLHAAQYDMIDKLMAGQIKSGDALYGQAMMFAANATANAYLMREDSDEGYQLQPMERDAEFYGDLFLQALRKELDQPSGSDDD